MIKRLLAAAALCSTLPAFAANLIADGSFESVAEPAAHYDYYSGIDSWSLSYPGASQFIEVRNAIVGTAQNGVNFVELDSTTNSKMYQTFATVVGQTYALSFYYSDRPVSNLNTDYQGVGYVVPASSNGLKFDLGGAETSVTAGTNTTADNIWTLYTTKFVATGKTTTLSFTAEGTSDSVGTSLDNVSVSAVPEPASLAMMGAGLLAMMGLARRRNSGK